MSAIELLGLFGLVLVQGTIFSVAGYLSIKPFYFGDETTDAAKRSGEQLYLFGVAGVMMICTLLFLNDIGWKRDVAVATLLGMICALALLRTVVRRVPL